MEQTSHDGASPGPPKPGVTHPPAAPALLPRDAPRAAHHPGVSKQPGIPGWLPQAGSPHWLRARTLIWEPRRPPSMPAGEGRLSARDLPKAKQRRPATCPAFFPGGSSILQPVHGGTASAAGGILRARHPPGFGLSSIAPASHHPAKPRAQREETSLSSQRKEIKITRQWRYRGIWPRSQNKSAALQYSHSTCSVSGHVS